MAKTPPTKKQDKEATETKRTYVSQSDVPIYSIDEALRIPQALVDNYAGGPATPLHVASALNMSPASGTFRNLCGSALAYGLTVGGYNAPEISLDSLGKRIVSPEEEEEDLIARREAVLKPRILSEFIRKYQNAPLPRRDIALNVLASMGVPRERTESVYTLILDTAQSVGFVREIKGKQYIDLIGVASKPAISTQQQENNGDGLHHSDNSPVNSDSPEKQVPKATPPIHQSNPQNLEQINRRVFVTHGKNRAFIDPIKKLLGFGEMIPVVSVERESVSKPVPDKVMDDMRSCGAAIIHVDGEIRLIDQEAKEHTVIQWCPI